MSIDTQIELLHLTNMLQKIQMWNCVLFVCVIKAANRLHISRESCVIGSAGALVIQH